MNEKANRKKKRLFQSLGVVIVFLFLLRMFIFSNYEVDGESMMPTLQDGNRLLVNKLDSTVQKLERFDIVVFHGNHDDYVKRIIGLPGEKIEYIDDVLYVSDKPVEEPFLQQYKMRLVGSNLTGDFSLEEVTGELTVPDGHVFILGDNRLGSWDSRHYGFIPVDQIVGTVNVRYWPIKKFELIY